MLQAINPLLQLFSRLFGPGPQQEGRGRGMPASPTGQDRQAAQMSRPQSIEGLGRSPFEDLMTMLISGQGPSDGTGTFGWGRSPELGPTGEANTPQEQEILDSLLNSPFVTDTLQHVLGVAPDIEFREPFEDRSGILGFVRRHSPQRQGLIPTEPFFESGMEDRRLLPETVLTHELAHTTEYLRTNPELVDDFFEFLEQNDKAAPTNMERMEQFAHAIEDAMGAIRVSRHLDEQAFSKLTNLLEEISPGTKFTIDRLMGEGPLEDLSFADTPPGPEAEEMLSELFGPFIVWEVLHAPEIDFETNVRPIQRR